MPHGPSAAATCAIVADDDEFFRIALASILIRRLGFAEVCETASLDEALERLDASGGSTPVTLALFDLSMPGMESAASLAAVRECYPDMRVVVVSASIARQDILLALSVGVHGYIAKGLGAAELARALRSILDGNMYVPPSLADLGQAPAREPSDPKAKDYDVVPQPAPEVRPHPPHGRTPAEDPNDRSSRVACASKAALQILTQRQIQVLSLLIEGRSNKEIARTLGLGEGTVKVHVAALLRNLGVANRSAAAVAGARLLVPVPEGSPPDPP